MKDNLTLDYLNGTNVYLYQRKDMFRMNTDTALLGHFMDVKEGESVLDIGCNNAALLLYASLKTSGKLIGVDVQKEACELAVKNLEYNHISDFEILNQDISEVQIEPVDVALCNPPYFKVTNENQLNGSIYKRIARHECYLTLDVLIPKVKECLKDYGRFYLVHRSDRVADILCLLRENQLEVKRMQFIRDENNEVAHGILIEAVKYGKAHCIVEKEHIVRR